VIRALLALVVVLASTALAPAAEARCMAPLSTPHAKSKKGCRKMPGRSATVHAVAPMVAASLQAADEQPASPVPDPPAETPAPAPAARLGVVAREWSLVLSRSTLAAGRAIVQLKNIGEDAHNLRIESASAALDVPLAESGEVQEAEGTLPAGDYKVYCALPGHEAAGMRARLTVTP
jgi:plastocyanin